MTPEDYDLERDRDNPEWTQNAAVDGPAVLRDRDRDMEARLEAMHLAEDFSGE